MINIEGTVSKSLVLVKRIVSLLEIMVLENAISSDVVYDPERKSEIKKLTDDLLTNYFGNHHDRLNKTTTGGNKNG